MGGTIKTVTLSADFGCVGTNVNEISSFPINIDTKSCIHTV